MLYRHVFDKISTEFCGILYVFVNFTDLPEFCGSTTVRNMRSPETVYVVRLKFYNLQLSVDT